MKQSMRRSRELLPAPWTFERLVNVLYRRAKLVLVASVFALALSAVYLALAPERYTATAMLLPDTKRVPPSPTAVVQEGLVDPAIVENQIETIKSEQIAAAVIDKFGFWRDPEFVTEGPNVVDRTLAMIGFELPTPASDTVRRRAAIGRFLRMLNVTRLGRSYVVSIAFTSKDPQRAAMVANEVVNCYIQDQLGSPFLTAERTSRWVQQRIAELDGQISDASRAVDLQRQSRLSGSSTDGKATEQDYGYDNLSVEVAQARTRAAEMEGRVDRIQTLLARQADRSALPSSELLALLNNSAITELMDAYHQTKAAARESAELASHSETDGPDDTRLNALREQIWGEVERAANVTAASLAVAKSEIDRSGAQLTSVRERVDRLDQHPDHLRELEANQRRLTELRSALQNRYARVADFMQLQALPTTEARVIAEATPPLAPSSPKSLIVLLAASCAGLILGVGSAFMREHFDTAIRRSSQIEEVLDLRPLGVLPLVRRAKSKTGAKAAAACELLPLANCEWLEQAGDTLRRVRIALEEGVTPAGRTIAVASPEVGVGKTTVALSLAMISVAAGQRTLLIDGDLRNPTLTKGLLSGGHPLSENGPDAGPGWARRIANHPLGFDFLGPSEPLKCGHSADVLGSRRMCELLGHMRAAYETIIIDTPALLEQVDVAAMGSMIDAIVVVLQCGRSKPEDVERALSVSAASADRVVGAVINKSPA